jgi:NAD(P)-dependent dehydrogenase (short-subunit alcohol dehydrogenase family)
MKCALVTGGTRGIGLAIAEALGDVGYSVTGIGYRSADLSQRHERHDVIQKFINERGGIDILVNNAGEQCFHPALEYPATQWDHNLALMLTAPFELSKQAAKYMLAHDGGHIVNILSTSAFQGARNVAGYVAAKHGLLGLTRALAIEWAPKVHVNAVAPGLTQTDMTDSYITPEKRAQLEAITPGGRFCTPQEIAAAVVFLVQSTAMYGQVITVDNGWMAKNG